MPEPKDIYLVRVYYKGQLGAFKSRPVLIINNLGNGWVTIAEITSVPPKKPPSHYDKYKELIIRWAVYGLANRSFIKCKNVHNIEISRLFQKIGVIDDDEFMNIIDKLICTIRPLKKVFSYIHGQVNTITKQNKRYIQADISPNVSRIRGVWLLCAYYPIFWEHAVV